MTHLTKAETAELKQYFPLFVSGETEYFYINQGASEVGIFAIEKAYHPNYKGKSCEIGLHIFSDFRFKIRYKEGLKLLLYFPFSLGYDNVLIYTVKKSVITLLLSCGKIGVQPLGIHNGNFWFIIQSKEINDGT